MKKLYFLGLFSLLLLACRKEFERPSWEVDVVGPVVYTSLGISDMIPDSLLQVNPDSSITLVLNTTIYELKLDTLVSIPDTTVNDIFQLPAFVPPQNVVPGQQLFSLLEESSFNVTDVELTDALLLAGTCQITLSSTINEPVDFRYQIPSAKKNGVSFDQTITIPAGSISNPTFINATFDLSGYALDLRGTTHPFNSYSTEMTVTMSLSGQATVVTSSDKVIVSAGFNNLQPRFAKGYFGNRVVSSLGEVQEFDFFKNIVAGTLDIDQVDVILKISNWIGVDASANISLLEASNLNTGISQALSNAIINNTIHLNRATNSGWYSTPTFYQVNLNNGNSNIDELIEVLANQFAMNFSMEINPLGDVSGHNDFIYHDQTLKADLNIVLPLHAIANGLTLVDTLNISLNKGDNGYVTEGKFYIDVANGFPLNGQLELFFIDQNGLITDNITSSGNFTSGVTNASNIVTSKSNSVLEFRLNRTQMERIYNNEKMVLRAVFNTSNLSQHVVLYDHYRIDLKIRGDFNYRIEAK